MADPQIGFAPSSPFATAVKNLGMDKPEVPAETYDAFRESYFNKRIAPRLHPDQRDKQRQSFLERTKRPEISALQHINSLVNISAQATEATFEKPFGMLPGSVGKSAKAQSAKDQAGVDKERQFLRYHGASGGGVAEFEGGVGAYAVATPIAEGALGLTKAIPVVGAVAKVLNYGSPGIMGGLKRSLAFGALQGASADPGQHSSEFVKGMGWGIGGELTGAAMSGLWKYYKGRKQLPSLSEVDEFMKGMARGEVADTQTAKDLDAALAESVNDRAKKPGYLDGLTTSLDEKMSRPIAIFQDESGTKFESPLSGSTEKIYAQLKEAIEGNWQGPPPTVGAKAIPTSSSGRRLVHIVHDEMDTEKVNEVLAKLKQNYEPWSPTASQIGTTTTNKGIDAGGGTARVDDRVFKQRYAKEAPAPEEARRFVKAAVGTDQRRISETMSTFDQVWNPFANWMARSEAAAKLEHLGLTDIIPSPETRAKWRPSEGLNLPKIFNEKGWYDRLDRISMRAEDGSTRTLDLREKDHLTSAMKTVWDPSVPHNSPMFRSGLRVITQYELNEFLPGRLYREEVASLLNETRSGTETEAKAISRLEQARKEPQGVKQESYYERVGRLAETFAKQKNPDQEHFRQLYGHQVVDAAMNMAALMWERSEGDILKVKWDQDIIKAGIEEGHLLSADASIEASGDLDSLRKASLESRVLRLAEQYNVDPKNIDRELLEEVGEAGVEHAREIADAAKKRGVSVYDASVFEEARRLGVIGDDTSFSRKSGRETGDGLRATFPEYFRGVPSSELPSREPGEPSGLPIRNVRLGDGKIGQFAYSVKRAASGQPSRFYLMFNDEVNKALAWSGTHATAATVTRTLEKEGITSVAADIRALAELHGVELDKTLMTVVHRPNAGFQKGMSAATVWHEDLHGMLSQLGLIKAVEGKTNLRNSTGTVNKLMRDVYDKLPPRLQDTWSAFSQALDQRYGKLYQRGILPEEGFVHAATAIRHGDVGTIAHFGAVDTDVEHVYEAVESIAGELRKAAGEMAPGASKNVIMDRLGFLEGISTPDRYKAIRQAAEQMFADLGADPETIMSQGGAQRYKDSSKIFAAAEDKLEGRTFAPNYTSWAEAAGARHAMYPTQMAPGRPSLPMPEVGLEHGEWKAQGAAKLADVFMPFVSWTNWVDKNINKVFGAKGANLPLADDVRAVLENHRAGQAWFETNSKSALNFLVGGKKKLETYGWMMTRPLKEWGGLAQKMELTNDDLARLKLGREWLTNFEGDTGVRAMNYLQELQPKLASHGFDVDRVFPAPAKGSSMSTFHRLISTGELNPKDLHLGRMVQVFMREGMEKKFTGEALQKLQKTIDVKADGKYLLGDLRTPVARWVEHMRGIPDNSAKTLNGFVSSMQLSVNETIANINKHLPKGFQAKPIDWQSTGDVIRKMVLLNYTSMIGGRPAIAARDALQGVSLSLPIIGADLFTGISSIFEKGAWAHARESGAMLTGKNVGELFGDIYGDITPGGRAWGANKVIDVASQLLAPSRWGHNVARVGVFSGVEKRALPVVKALRALDRIDNVAVKGVPGTMRQFALKTNLWFADEARVKQLFSLAQDKFVDPKEVAKQIALEMNDLTLWAYRKGTQPGALRTGIGRVFGQFGLFPANFIDYTRRLVSKIPQYPEKALPAIVTFLAVNYGLVEGAKKAFNVDVARWFMASPAGYAGSPHLDFLLNVGKSFKEDQQGREARKKVLEYPLDFVPSYNEFRSVRDNWDKPLYDDQGYPTQAGLEVMGFRMYKPGDLSFDQVLSGGLDPKRWLEYETGEPQKGEWGKSADTIRKGIDKVTK